MAMLLEIRSGNLQTRAARKIGSVERLGLKRGILKLTKCAHQFPTPRTSEICRLIIR
jgi:hypothetical protein